SPAPAGRPEKEAPQAQAELPAVASEKIAGGFWRKIKTLFQGEPKVEEQPVVEEKPKPSDSRRRDDKRSSRGSSQGRRRSSQGGNRSSQARDDKSQAQAEAPIQENKDREGRDNKRPAKQPRNRRQPVKQDESGD